MSNQEKDYISSDELEALLLSDEYSEEKDGSDWFSSIIISEDILLPTNVLDDKKEDKQTKEESLETTDNENEDNFFIVENTEEALFEVDYDVKTSALNNKQNTIQNSFKKSSLCNSFYNNEEKKRNTQESMTISHSIHKSEKTQNRKAIKNTFVVSSRKTDTFSVKEIKRDKEVGSLSRIPYSESNWNEMKGIKENERTKDTKEAQENKGTNLSLGSLTTIPNRKERVIMTMERKNNQKKEML
ncbi:MAG: hypothetical protein IKK33_11350 [Lachnospiraceae bacterium]|nr:hypothetical protein [Lachnospiraceae bacterium]